MADVNLSGLLAYQKFLHKLPNWAFHSMRVPGGLSTKFQRPLRKVCYYSVEICAPLHGQIAISGQKVRNWPQLQDD